MEKVKNFAKELGLTNLDCILIFCLMFAMFWVFIELYLAFDYDTFAYAFEVV